MSLMQNAVAHCATDWSEDAPDVDWPKHYFHDVLPVAFEIVAHSTVTDAGANMILFTVDEKLVAYAFHTCTFYYEVYTEAKGYVEHLFTTGPNKWLGEVAFELRERRAELRTYAPVTKPEAPILRIELRQKQALPDGYDDYVLAFKATRTA